MTEKDKKTRPKLSNVWAEARALVWKYRSRLALGFGLMLVNRLAGLVIPMSSKYLIDDVVGNSRTDLLPLLAGAALIATVVQASSSFALSQVLGVAAQRAITEMRKTVQQHVTRLPVSFFDSTKTGVLISRVMSDAEGIRNLVGTGLVQLVGGLLTSVIAIGVLFYLNWRLTVITVTILVLFAAAMAFAFTFLRPIFRERSKINAEVTGRLNETLGGVRIVKAYTAERRENWVFAKGAHKLFRNVARTITGISAITSFTTLIVGTIGVVMIMVGGKSMLSGAMTLGDFVMYLMFTGMMVAPLMQMASIGTQVTEAFAGLDRIRELREMATEDEEDQDRAVLENVKGDMAFEDVWFEYKADTPVLKGISFEASAGTTTALVGSSGSGKSTIIGLVMAFNRPKQGTVRVDGKDLREVRLHDFRSALGAVLQDNFLFDGSIKENIAFGCPGATDQEIIRAATVAHCDEFISEFQDGYDTIVGERGVRLSGGQRQRVAIARAILADPKLLILDEATSSLDSESEALIQDGLNNLRKGRTTFVIAHRLSTVQSADQILVIEDGQIVERGTHTDLLEMDGRYRELYDRQYRIERNRFINPGEDFTPEPEAEEPPKGRARGPRDL
ncbi:MAG: ABC transporter ATP-binding protein/permease [Gemmatimonadota bacterium]|nr:ABC transporter ATP-binding protein/permease [Gemmatimonadota bacterium]